MKTEIKVIRTWTTPAGKTWETIHETCDRCGGSGIFYTGMHNGVPRPATPDAGMCYKCLGTGTVQSDRRVLTEKEKAARERSHARKAEARATERAEKEQQYIENRADMLSDEFDRMIEKETRIAALRARSEFQGNVGDKIELTLTVKKIFDFETQFGRKYINIMEDENGNCFKWNTDHPVAAEGTTVTLKGTVKEHETYKDQKQTILTRCKEVK